MEEGKLPRGYCSNCGKEIPVKDLRHKKPEYCNRICSSLAKFKMRYRGSMSGPMDRPKFNAKGEKV